MGTAAVLIPLATDTASGALEQVIGQAVGDISFGQDLKESMRVGYSTGNDRENQQGNDSETG